MDIVSPENRFLEESKSAELTACLQTIQETTVDDIAKFSDKTCRELARLIVCRSYPSTVLELCHLVVAAVHCGTPDRRYEPLFFSSGTARTSSFQSFFLQIKNPSPAFTFAQKTVEINYWDQVFTINYSRMPVLSALLEFLMTTIGYGQLDDHMAPALQAMPAHKQVSEMANALSKSLYGYLADHLPPVQEQRKSQSFLRFLSANATAGLSAIALNDNSVLDYWLAHSSADTNNQTLDVKTYRSVFRMACQLIRILQYADEQYRLTSALPIGTDFDGGEIDPSDLEQALAEIDPGNDPLDDLEEVTGAGLKIVTKREMTLLREVLHGDAVGRELTRSILRNATFGEAQAGLVQALRQSKSSLSAELISDLPDDDYRARISQYAALAGHLDQMLLAILYVLTDAGHAFALSIALALKPDLDLSPLAAGVDEPDWQDDTVVSFTAATAARQFFAAMKNPDGDLRPLFEQAEKTYKAISRQGFAKKPVAQRPAIEQFVHGGAALMALRKELSALLHRHLTPIDWDQQMQTDRPLFRAQFMILYGGQNG